VTDSPDQTLDTKAQPLGASNISNTKTAKLPSQRWCQPTPEPQKARQLADITGLSPLLAQVLINRGISTEEQAREFLDPEQQRLPAPVEEFPDLTPSLELLVDAIEGQQSIAICGDYDADGMTSTALLLRALRILGAAVEYAIPSRMAEGYGINQRIVEDFYADGVSLILTVDNGIGAVGPIQRARELGLAVIVTDHHDIPPELPPANAILNPKLLPETSPYRGVAGVGVAYILAVCLAQALDKNQDLTAPLLELFTLGTIADLAPLVGVNRRWVRRGLGLLPRSQILGIQALIQVAGLADQSKPLKPEHIGFRLGPRINAVGRISDPQIVIEMLTTDDVGVALERAMQCEQINQSRQDLCQKIEAEAIAWCEHQQKTGAINLTEDRVLLVVQPDWHHGVIGIVASRLVERYGVPVFIGTYEDEEHKIIRGSARGIPEFDVFAALQACGDLMDKFGGHRAAGGFSFPSKHLRQVKTRLVNYANEVLTVDLLKPLVTIDVQASLADISQTLYDQIDYLHPCGIENPDPIFWTPNVQVVEQQVVGRNRNHLKLVLAEPGSSITIKAIAWRWGEYYPLPDQVDIAYKLKQNDWQGNRTVELELVGVQTCGGAKANFTLKPVTVQPSPPLSPPEAATQGTVSPAKTPPTAAPSGSQPLVTSPASQNNQVQPLSSDPSPARVTRAANQTTSASARVAAPQAETNGRTLPSSAQAQGATPPSPGMHPDHRVLHSQGVDFHYSKRRYWATIDGQNGTRQLTIGNPEGQLLVVSLSERQGFLCVPGAAPKPVNVSESHYFNLVRAGLNAVELQQMERLLIEKDELLADKDAQIQTLSRQVALLEQQLNQVPHPEQHQFKQLQKTLEQQETAIQTQEAHIAKMQAEIETPAPAINTKQIRQRARKAMGDSAWFCLSAASQKDLYAAFKQQEILKAETEGAADYSAAATHLIKAAEREILTPLLQGFTDYGQHMQDADLMDLATTLNQEPKLGDLPPLLSESWSAMTPKALNANKKPRKLLATFTADEAGDMDDTHRVLLDEFLQGWDHPMAQWIIHANRDAASSLGQIYQLQELVTADDIPLHQWQYQLMQQLMLGKAGEKGIFQKIFGGAS
jgi:single-stranded-DNA-specific exonuclease RecJ